MRKEFSRAILFASVIMASCEPSSFSSVEELTTYIRSSSLHQKKTIGKINISVTYKPTDILVYEEVGLGQSSNTSIASVRERYIPFQYFIVSFSVDDKELLASLKGTGPFSDVLNTLSFNMGEHVQLRCDASLVSPFNYSMANTFGFGNSTDLIFAFEKKSMSECERYEIVIKEFGLGIGDTEFPFDKEQVDDLPPLVF